MFRVSGFRGLGFRVKFSGSGVRVLVLVTGSPSITLKALRWCFTTKSE